MFKSYNGFWVYLKILISSIVRNVNGAYICSVIILIDYWVQKSR